MPKEPPAVRSPPLWDPVRDRRAGRLSELDPPAAPPPAAPAARLSAWAVGKAALWSVGNAATSQGLSLLAFLITARIISPAAFGLVAIATLIVEVSKRLVVEPLAIRLMSLPDPSEDEYNEFFSSIVLLSGLGSAAIFLLAYPIAWILREPPLAPVVELIAVVLFGTGLWRSHEIWYSKRFEYHALAVRSSIASAFGGATGIGMALAGFGVWSLVAQQLVSTAVTVVLLVFLSPWRPRLRFHLGHTRRHLGSARHLALINVLNFVGYEADVFFITYYLGSTAAGIYSAAKRLMLAANLIIVSSTGSVILALFSRGSENPAAYQRLLNSLLVVGLVFFPVFVGLSLLGTDVIALLLNKKWLASGAILSILALSTLGQGMASLVTNYLIAARADRQFTAVVLGGAVATVCVLPLLAHVSARGVAFGVAAITWSSLVALCIAAAAREGRSVLAMLKALALPAAGAGAMTAAYLLLPFHAAPLLRLLLLPPLLLAVFAVTVTLLGYPEMKRLVSIARRRGRDAPDG
ncbi:hypothetical protein HMF7854_09755 [Sphingomonas ginkgonis]|uniref:Lipopolysaccharide biosynthesis protein n=1 Tax=Sphingomonas ginkgonis TaxID=2315330 RepID=A0A429VAS6_9SPHN|nr:oligosaccharide flippase family protein [Sphingomonas ginkgonis]RST31090.1 hypothetical protein HMF7854_09755 [Sphingomonas ginkgonis]